MNYVRLLGKGAINPLFCDTVTIYNHVLIDRVDRWEKTIIKGVQWTRRQINTMNDSGRNVVTEKTLITIPITANSGGRGYVLPSDFARAADRSKVWTLNAANGNDLVVRGACDAEITQDYTPAQLIKDYGAVSITVVRDNTAPGILKNWKVECV